MDNYLHSKINLFLILANVLAASILALGVLFLFFGLSSLLLPDLIFYKLILPLANILSKTGRLRTESTLYMLYQEWLNFGIYISNIVGIAFIVFSSIWLKLKREAGDEVLAKVKPFRQERQPQHTYIILLILMTIAGLLLRVININQSLWSDEIATLIHFIRPFKFWRYTELGDHWLYTFLGYWSIKIFGESEPSLRLPGFLLGTAAIPLIYYFAKAYISKAESILASILICFSAFHIKYSVEARGYSALAFFSLLSSMLFLRIILKSNSEDNSKEAVWLSVSTALGMLSHFYYIWVISAQYCTLLFFFLKERIIKREVKFLTAHKGSNLLSAIASGVSVALIIYGPFFIVAVIYKYIGWHKAGEVILSLGSLGYLLSGNLLNNSVVILSLALVVLGIRDFWVVRKYPLTVYFIFLFIPFIFVSLAYKISFMRYFIYLLPVSIFALAHGICTLLKKSGRPLRIIILSLFILFYIFLQLPALIDFYSYRQAGIQDFRSMGRLIDSLAADGDIVSNIGLAQSDLTQYYIKRHRVLALSDEELLGYLSVLPKRKLWLIVTFPEFLYPKQLLIYRMAQNKLWLIGYFRGAASDIIVYLSKK